MKKKEKKRFAKNLANRHISKYKLKKYKKYERKS